MAVSYLPKPVMEAGGFGPASGSLSAASWQPPAIGHVTRPASDDDLAFMTVTSLLSTSLPCRSCIFGCRFLDSKLKQSLSPAQIQQLGSLLRSKAVTSVQLARLSLERLRR